MKLDLTDKHIDLNGSWEFTYTPGRDFSSRGYDITTGLTPEAGRLPTVEEFDCAMPVPGYWDDHLDTLRPKDWWAGARFNPNYRPIEFPMGLDSPDGSLSFLVGTGWYRKEFFVPQGWQGGMIGLYLGGVVMDAAVWVNRVQVGGLGWHSTAAEFRIEPFIRFGEANEVIIAVDNTRLDRIGLNIRGYPGRSGGIYRSVAIHCSGMARIEDFHLWRTGSSLNWRAELSGDIQPDAILKWTVTDRQTGAAEGQGELPACGGRVEWQTGLLGLKPWSDREPALYDVQVQLAQARTVQDSVKRPFGMRTLESQGTGLALNGKPVLLRGATEHFSYPLTCTAPGDVDTYLNNLRKVKELGFNWLRFHTWVPSEEYMEAADRVGIMIQVEPAMGFTVEEWTAIVRVCRKHPSVVIYCCGNEEVIDEAKIELMSRLSAIQHELAPDGLFNPMEALKGIEYGSPAQMGDHYTNEPFPFNCGRLEKVNAFSDVLGSFAQTKLSYWSVTCDWRQLNGWMAMYGKPILSHEVGILGSYLNLDLEHRYEHLRIGTQMYASVRKNLEKAGLLDRAARYYQNSCRWLALLRKHCLENARKCGYLSGYDLLGFVDTHWTRCGYPCGIMNEFYEMKPYHSVSDVLTYNGESVLLLDHTNQRNFLCGDRLEVELYASLYGDAALKLGRWSWYTTVNGRITQRVDTEIANVPNGGLTGLGLVAFDMPELSVPQKLTVHASLSGGEYELINSWDFWVFPKVESIQTDDVQVVDMLDEATLEALGGSAAVLLLGGSPFKTMATRFQATQCGRANGNMATLLNEHPAWGSFPQEGFCDWQFFSMLEGGCTVECNDLHMPFEPIAEFANSFKETLKKAAMFEVTVGRGRLFVCTFNMDTADPAAAFLLGEILKYCRSELFRPRYSLPIEDLYKLLEKKPKPMAMPSTDIVDDSNVRRLIEKANEQGG
jgi:beta-galactosidase